MVMKESLQKFLNSRIGIYLMINLRYLNEKKFLDLGLNKPIANSFLKSKKKKNLSITCL